MSRQEALAGAAAEPVSDQPVTASIWILLLYDVCEEINLNELRRVVGMPVTYREPAFPYPTPEYLRVERPPVVEALEGPWVNHSIVGGHVAYYDFGVVAVQLECAFSGSWRDLIDFVARSVAEPSVKRLTDAIVRERLEQLRPAFVKTYPEFLEEDYYIVHVPPLSVKQYCLSADELLNARREAVAMVVRADAAPPSVKELHDALQSGMSYSPGDLAVFGWNAAFVYDTPEGAAPVVQLLEYANAQLLEFRRYDEVLTDLLTGVYGILENRRGFWYRWRFVREAQRLNTIRLDVRELTERIDNSIKFFGDVFSARLYRLAASKIGVPDYRKLVDDKLRTAHELYVFMMDQFHQSRAFILELMIVIILIIDLIFLFRGRS
jgi:hypothetical protein